MKLSTVFFFVFSLPVVSGFQPHHAPTTRVLCRVSEKSSGGFELPKSFDGLFNDAEKARGNLMDQTSQFLKQQDSSQNFDMDKIRGRFDELRNSISTPPSFDISKIMDSSDAIRDNVFSGELGQRGEYYVLAQFSLIAFIAVGGVPVLGDLVTIVLGPGLLLAGLATIVLAVQDMGGSLSPWPTTNERTELVTTGTFQYVRHPIYAGLLASLAGLSLVTGSALRLLLTVALWKVLEEKSTFEEEQLKEAFPGKYDAYSKQVSGKFFPSDWSLDMSFLKQDKP